MHEKIEQEMGVRFRVVLAYAVTDPLAMMVHTVNAPVASPAVVVPGGFDLVAYFTVIGRLE